MAFRNLTNLGKEYLAARLANELPVKFIKAKIGNGSVPLSTDPAQTTELYGFKKQVTILKAVQEQNSIKLTIQITNDGVNEGFYLKEIGIYVDDNGKEVLYWYCNEDNSQYINAQTDTPLSFEVDIMMEVTNINSAVVEWTGKDTWVNKEFLKDEVAKKLDKGAVSTEYDTAAKIEAKIKIAHQAATSAGNAANAKLPKGNLPTQIVDAKGICDLLENNSGSNFDPNLLFLNDPGTKTQGKIYFDKNKKGMFKCIKQTTGTVNSTEFFEDISNNANSDRLNNLGNPLPKFLRVVLTKEPLKVESGLYMVYRLHDGMRKQSKVYFLSITGYKGNTNENKFIRAQSFINDFDNSAYAIEYNSATCEIKLINDQIDEVADYVLAKLV